jgi:hypothetical protein
MPTDEQLRANFPAIDIICSGHAAYEPPPGPLPCSPLVQLLRLHTGADTGACSSSAELIKELVDGVAGALSTGYVRTAVLPLQTLAQRDGWHKSAVVVGGLPSYEVETAPLMTQGTLAFMACFDRVSVGQPFRPALETIGNWSALIKRSLERASQFIDGIDFDHYSSGGRITRLRRCVCMLVDAINAAELTTLLEELSDAHRGERDVTTVLFRGQEFHTTALAADLVHGIDAAQRQAGVPWWCRLDVSLHSTSCVLVQANQRRLCNCCTVQAGLVRVCSCHSISVSAVPWAIVSTWPRDEMSLHLMRSAATRSPVGDQMPPVTIRAAPSLSGAVTAVSRVLMEGLIPCKLAFVDSSRLSKEEIMVSRSLAESVLVDICVPVTAHSLSGSNLDGTQAKLQPYSALWHQGYRHARIVRMGTVMATVLVSRCLMSEDKLHVCGHKGLALVCSDDDPLFAGGANLVMQGGAIITRQQAATLWLTCTVHAQTTHMDTADYPTDPRSFMCRVLRSAGSGWLHGCFQVASRLPEHAARYSATRDSCGVGTAGVLRRDHHGDDFIAVDTMTIDALAAAVRGLTTSVVTSGETTDVRAWTTSATMMLVQCESGSLGHGGALSSRQLCRG